MSFRGANKESVTNSNLALRIIGVLASEETFPSLLSKKLGIHIAVLNDYIRSLEKHGIIEKSTRTKSQMYKIRPEGIGALWREVWISNIERISSNNKEIDLEKTKSLIDSIHDNKYFGSFLMALFEVPNRFEEKDNLGRILYVCFRKTLIVFFEEEITEEENVKLNSKKLNDPDLQKLRDDLRVLYDLNNHFEKEVISEIASISWAVKMRDINRMNK